jgi:hypothetical protein
MDSLEMLDPDPVSINPDPQLWLEDNERVPWYRVPLSLPVNSVAGLALHLWVPVHVQHEEMVGSHQVQAHSSSCQR